MKRMTSLVLQSKILHKSHNLLHKIQELHFKIVLVHCILNFKANHYSYH